jgi:hypothetical protein
MDGRTSRAVLGVRERATREDIKRAYRARVLETHPDRGGDRAEFEAVVRAYEALADADPVAPARRNPFVTVFAPRPTPTWSMYDTPPARPRRAPHRPEPIVRFEEVLRVELDRLAAAEAARAA